MDISCNYMGLKLQSPVIAGANDWTANPDKTAEMEEAGAGALVIKSLFEEQVELEHFKWDEQETQYDALHPMMVEVGPHLEYSGPRDHFHTVHKIAEKTTIPVIASLNAVSRDAWLQYAQELADTGVDGLELNLYASPRDSDYAAAAIETAQLAMLQELQERIDIPMSVKLSPFYTNPTNFITRIDQLGTFGFVLFNRLFQPDIDPEAEKNIFPFNLSQPADNRLPLRYAGLLHGQLNGDICASTGIFEGRDIAKMLLAGADCVQVVSTMLKQGTGQISTILAELRDWMQRHEYETLDDFRGKMSRKNNTDPWVYTRAQYIDMLLRGNPLQR